MIDMTAYHAMLRENNITLVYSGPLWAEGIGGFAGTIKKRLEFDALPLEMSQAVFSVFVEQMNNMLMYSAEKEQFASPDDMRSQVPKGTFILGKRGKAYFMQTGNVIKAETASLVKERIDYLNTLDKRELRQYHKEQARLTNDNPDSKGAGLGLIEMARRAGSKIEYTFTPYEDGHMFFNIYITIDGE